MGRVVRRALALALASAPAYAFYLPGAAPHDYARGDPVPLLVNALTPQVGNRDLEIKSVLAYDYYDPRFHHCEPKGGATKQSEALGAILFGDRLRSSAFDVRMLEEVQCRTLCEAAVPADDATFINDRIRESYAMNWLVDGLPAAEMRMRKDTGETFYSIGFELGSTENGPAPQLNNHYSIYIDYHARSADVMRVVGVVVWPSSSATSDCTDKWPFALREDGDNTVRYTYSVNFRESAVPWATRWDAYLRVVDPRIHWLSLINAAVLASFLCAMVLAIVQRTVSRDLHRYNAHDLSEDVQEDSGWKLIHADVFRTPRRPMLMAIVVGSGAQLAAMAAVTILFALFGFLSPSNRGSLPTVMIVTWTLFAAVSGYVSAKLYSTFGGASWQRNIALTATTFPALLFAALFLLNLFLLSSGSSGAIPFGTMLAVLALWFLISVPLTVVGSVVALRGGPISLPAHVNAIPRQIPPQPRFLHPWPRAAIGGLLPFGAAFIELFFVLNSLFSSRVYIAFGFLALTFGLVVLTTSTVTVLLAFFSLSSEDHRWAWRSFHTGGGVALWLFGYGLLYWATRLSLAGFASKILYLGYLSIMSLVVCASRKAGGRS